MMGTPPERYDPALASSLLKGRGEEVIDTATRNLLSRGVLSKSQRDPTKQKPGRQLKISEVFVESIFPCCCQISYMVLSSHLYHH